MVAGYPNGDVQAPDATVDMRSDTVTAPLEGMRHAMAQAEVGDDVFGDDPTVIKLQNRVAAWLDHLQPRVRPRQPLCNQKTTRADENKQPCQVPAFSI